MVPLLNDHDETSPHLTIVRYGFHAVALPNACRARMSAAMAKRRVNFDSSVTRVDFIPNEKNGTTITNRGHASFLYFIRTPIVRFALIALK